MSVQSILFSMLIITLLFLSFSTVPAVTIHVPSEEPTIQTGIDASVDGDTVLVADGTFTGAGNLEMNFGGRAITVRSENGPDSTTVDCEWNGRGFVFESGEGPDSRLEGFSITHASALAKTGAIYITDSSPTITECRLNYSWAIFSGSVMSCRNSTAVIENCEIFDNSSQGNGGGMFINYSSIEISGSTIYGNSAKFRGGGIYCSNSQLFLSDCSISRNSATSLNNSYGGGISCTNSFLTMDNCVIDNNNTLGYAGGGIYIETSSAEISNCFITENFCFSNGGGLSVHDSSPVLTNCTLSGNEALWGSTLSIYDGASPILIGCILRDEDTDRIYIDSGSLNITYTDIEGGWSGEGNIDDDPMFVSMDYKDYRLQWGSPCIDAGSPDFPLDPDGTAADMGASFFDQSKVLTIYMSPQAHTVNRGSSGNVLYTICNTNAYPADFLGQSLITLPDGEPWEGNPLEGPEFHTVPPDTTIQTTISEWVPMDWPLGVTLLTAEIGLHGELFDDDYFEFEVTE